MVKRTAVLMCLFALAYASMASARTPPAAEGLITQSTGQVVYRLPVKDGKPIPAKPFIEARRDDTFELAKGARVRIVYLQTGTQESWTGPAQFKVGLGASTHLAGAKPGIQKLPAKAVGHLKAVPALLKRTAAPRKGTKARLRGVQEKDVVWRLAKTLTPAEQAQLNEAVQTHAALTKVLGPGDATADLALAGELGRLRLGHTLKVHLEASVKRHPANGPLKDLNGWVSMNPMPSP